jgi:NADH-quinone oxidoreductase subunit G
VPAAEASDAQRAALGALKNGARHGIFLGTLAQRHPAYAQLKALAIALGALTGASVGFLTEGANAAGAYLAGAVPHREPGGAPAPKAGLSVGAMAGSRRKAYVLLGGIDPALDLADPSMLGGADLIIAITTHLPESLRDLVHVVLPMSTFAETSGTYVNAEGRWQSWAGAATPVGDSRPGWKILRVLANLLNIRGVDYDSSDQVRDALRLLCGARVERSAVTDTPPPMPNGRSPEAGWVDVPPYQVDVLVRGSEPLSKTKDGRLARGVI